MDGQYRQRTADEHITGYVLASLQKTVCLCGPASLLKSEDMKWPRYGLEPEGEVAPKQ